MTRSAAVVLALLGIASAAHSQSVTISINAQTDPIPQVGESITITVTASFNNAAAFAGFWFDIVPSGTGFFPPSGTTSDPQYLNGLGDLASGDPTPNGGGYRNIQAANLPVPFGGNTSNPIDLFSYTFTRVQPRQIEFTLVTNPRSDVPGARLYTTADSFAADAAPTVLNGLTLPPVPAPGATVVLALAACGAARRRR